MKITKAAFALQRKDVSEPSKYIDIKQKDGVVKLILLSNEADDYRCPHQATSSLQHFTPPACRLHPAETIAPGRHFVHSFLLAKAFPNNKKEGMKFLPIFPVQVHPWHSVTFLPCLCSYRRVLSWSIVAIFLWLAKLISRKSDIWQFIQALGNTSLNNLLYHPFFYSLLNRFSLPWYLS